MDGEGRDGGGEGGNVMDVLERRARSSRRLVRLFINLC